MSSWKALCEQTVRLSPKAIFGKHKLVRALIVRDLKPTDGNKSSIKINETQNHMYVLTHLLLIITLIRIAWIDWRTQRIYHLDLWILFILSMGYLYLKALSPWEQIIQALCVGGVFLVLKKTLTQVKKSPALGTGDVKLTALLSLMLPLHSLPVFFLYAALLGLLTRILWKKPPPFPFAPALILGFYLAFWFKNPL